MGVIAAVWPVIFLAELPDKTMFASLILATRGRPLAVWMGASLAFAVHVVIAVSIGTLLFTLLPHRVVLGFAALLFLAGAAFAWRDRVASEERAGRRSAELAGASRTVVTSFAVIFVAEWGDLTQILTATLAAQYQAALAVGVGALLALSAVAALAVGAGTLLERLPLAVLRQLTAVALLVLALVAGAEAVFGWRGPI